MLNAKSAPVSTALKYSRRAITIDKLTPVIGAEIGGIDLSRPLPRNRCQPARRPKFAAPSRSIW